MADDLSPEQIRALGEVFADPVSAGQLLERAGLGRGDDHPYTHMAAASLAATRRQIADQTPPPS
ncbi:MULTISPECIES: effector-associated domain EAD1-containing protein [Parafrankia]|uniref:effector-associated domain EAD1-containing protein n=1 Tax=Parafrankia TaxID=2994362 RepID=UPI000ABC3339|nr:MULTISPECIES: effector-associated domain EAD1-containing protein [Parafrankia]MBE3201513.1 hypothetical protein [Parafrankia sp. CH37]